MRARWFPGFACVVLLVALTPLRTVAAASDPGAFMADVSNRVLMLLNDRQRPEAEREKQFGALVDETFDAPRIARFVLGQSWRSASDTERQQFTQTFRTYMVQVYWSRFTLYDGVSFKVTGQQAQSSNITLVTTQIVQGSGQPPVKVDWTVAKTGDAYKIIDVSIAGISQVLTYRQEFASVIEQNNGQVSALIAELNRKIKS